MDGIPNFPTRLQVESANKIARRFVENAVEFRRDDMIRFLTAGEAFITAGQDALVNSDYLLDFAKGLYDTVGNAVGMMRIDLRGCDGDPSEADIDVTELTALILELEAVK
jgi:hypothetical protein